MVTSISNGDSSQIQQLMAEMRKKMKAADTDGVSGLSKDELSSISTEGDEGGANFLNSLTSNFDKIDTDANGQLSDDEIKTAKPKNRPMGPPPGMFIQDLSSYDTDGTSGLSKDELSAIDTSDDEGKSNFISSLTSKFDEIDTNADGQLSTGEIESSKPDGPPPGPPPESSSQSDSSTTDSDSLSTNLLDYLKKLISSSYSQSDSSFDFLSSINTAA